MSREGQKCNLWFSCSSWCQKWLRNLLLRKTFPPHTPARAGIPAAPTHTVWALSEQFPAHLWRVLCLLLLIRIKTFPGCRCDRSSEQGTSHPPPSWSRPLQMSSALHRSVETPEIHPHICGAPLSENGIFTRRRIWPSGPDSLTLPKIQAVAKKTPQCMQESHATAALSQTWAAEILHFNKNNPKKQELPT